MQKNKLFIMDMCTFYKLIGGAIELCDRGYDVDEAMDYNYRENVVFYADKYLNNYPQNCINDIDACLQTEHLLDTFFKNKLLEKIEGEKQ